MLSVGTYPETSLADARKAREKARQDLANDINPADARRNASSPDRSFDAVARHWLAKLAKKVRLGKRSVKTLKKATWTLETYVFPDLGAKHIGSIMKVEHVVPLSRQAITVVREALKLSVGSRWLFPCLGNPNRCMSENTVNDALRRMGYDNDEQTGQGIRVMASTLLNEQGWPPDAIEKQLAHIEENEVREVYNQAKYPPVRRQMMQFWADYLDELRKGNTGAVRDSKERRQAIPVRGRPTRSPRSLLYVHQTHSTPICCSVIRCNSPLPYASPLAHRSRSRARSIDMKPAGSFQGIAKWDLTACAGIMMRLSNGRKHGLVPND